MRAWLAAIALPLALAGCRSDRPSPVSPLGSSTVAVGSGAGSDPWAAGSSSAPDPWAVVAPPDAPPSLADRKHLADEACPSVSRPYFYKLEKNGHTNYILGTRHISIPLAKFPATVTDAIDTARLVVFEVAPDDEGRPSDSAVTDLADDLGPTLWKHYESIVGSEIAQAMQHESPTSAAIMMTALFEDPSAMLEKDIEARATTHATPMRGLETSAFQDDVLAKLLDLRMLKATVAHTEDRNELETDSKKEIHEYCIGADEEPGMDADERADLLDSGYTAAELDQIDNTLVFARNADWIPKLEKLFAGDHVFVAVGADHLRGPRGVIALLQARGFKATRQ